MRKLSPSELFEVTQSWVIGELFRALTLGRVYPKLCEGDDGKFSEDKFHDYALQIHRTIYQYITTGDGLDRDSSDAERYFSIKARTIFGLHGLNDT